MSAYTVPVLVNEDTVFQRSSNYSALVFWRQSAFPTAATILLQKGRAWEEEPLFTRSADNAALFFNRVAGTPTQGAALSYWRTGPSWTFFQDPFVSVYPVVELYDQTSITPQFIPTIYYKPSNRVDEIELEYNRADHGRYFWLQRRYVAQLIGHTFTVPDFNDDPWIEWVHPPQSPEAALFPFHQTKIFVRGQQFNLFYNQPKPWPVEEEKDTLDRAFKHGLLQEYPRPAIQILMPSVIGLQVLDAVTLLAGIGVTVVAITFEDTIYPIPPQSRGTVIGQGPLPGTVISPPTNAILIVSSGLMNLPQIGDSTNFNPPNTVLGSTQFP